MEAIGPKVRHLGAGLRVSASQVSTWLMCPRRYELKYVRGLPPSHLAGEAVLGSAVHESLAAYHEHVRVAKGRPAVEEVLELFERVFDEKAHDAVAILWPDGDSPTRLREQGRVLVRLYVETVSLHRVVAVEQPFVVEPERLPDSFGFSETLTGIVDLVEEESDGNVYITELKTSAKKFDENRLSHDLQIGLYAAAREALGVPNARLRFRVLLKAKQPAIIDYELRRDDAQIAEVGLVVTQVLRAIDHGIYPPMRSWACTTCPWRAPCGG